ncbi:hypothetical protein K3495_g9210 [Podosphaera aphanis]|nr:hypothetical protein K3495_g9210 [Podosphaera aphanis]
MDGTDESVLYHPTNSNSNEDFDLEEHLEDQEEKWNHINLPDFHSTESSEETSQHQDESARRVSELPQNTEVVENMRTNPYSG